jgi:hypothetical protein
MVKKDTATSKKRDKPDNESITFRLDSDAIAGLKKEASERDIGVNTVLSQMIKHYTKWHSIAAGAGYVYVRRTLLMKLLEHHTEQDMVSISDAVAKTTNRDVLMLFGKKVNMSGALDLIETWLKVSDIPFRHENSDNKHSFIVKHGMGKKWSIYMGELCRHMFRECNINKYDYDARDTTLSFVFEVPQNKFD